MPIRAFLDGQGFDDETTRLMGIAFELALASLRSSPSLDDPLRATLCSGHNCDGEGRGTGPRASV